MTMASIYTVSGMKVDAIRREIVIIKMHLSMNY